MSLLAPAEAEAAVAELSPQVPLHHVWLQGDNTRNSNDSRLYGPLPEAMLRSRVFFEVWPPSEWGRVRRDLRGARVVQSSA